MRAVIYKGAGGNEVIALSERPDPVPEGDELLVRVRYAGINPADLQQRNGDYPPPPGAPIDIPGLEVAGEVVAVGPRVLGMRVGTRVMGLVAGGGLADRVLISERHVCIVPDNLDDLAAAAVPEGFITAHDAIRSQAALRPGEVLLVNGATGGVGSAAVQIARASGARVIGTSRTERGRELVTSLGAIPADPENVAQIVQDVSAGRGADVVLELVGAPNLATDFAVLAVLGRVMVVGVGAGAEATINLRALMGRRGRLLASVLRARPTEDKAIAVRAFEREVLPHLASGTVRPIVDRVFPASDVAVAFDHVESGVKQGKVLLDFGS
ncbi:NAD(P)H-quinone oxidoreductase [Arthrobacter sp. TB 23]|uniref:NAD(P)H-quinone oxidoreductase n=1 Tax=Arthrobacter sp. TB 23 TaxID=494419 RepID=UPI0002FCCB70|nr:NAD(P)H-quinone oxidoreductase [Arthrobacter sp. TB 23]